MSQDHAATLRPPEHLHAQHDLSTFQSGVAALDDWLKRRALPNEESGASRTYVVCTEGMRVVGYYALANGAVALQGATGRIRRNMPDPIPVMVLGRLAMDAAFHGRGLGRSLLRDAILRTMQAAAIAGIRTLLVHAISEDAKRFYQRCGFGESPLDPLTLMITMADAQRSLARARRGA
jgi:GNAT superfamily N-acetyltransferase